MLDKIAVAEEVTSKQESIISLLLGFSLHRYRLLRSLAKKAK
jgi:hypothetical protein